MKYDFIVIGGGSAGLVAAKFANGLGKKTAIVEKYKLGGDCTHFGCIPSKALLHYSVINPSSGIRAFEHVREMVERIYQTETPDVFRKEGIDVIEGAARFIDSQTIEVNNVSYTARRFLLAMGSSPVVPPISGLDSINYLTNESIFSIKELPLSVVVLGGGPIGIELASALNNLGVDVAVVEMSDNILPREDRELSQILQKKLESDGIKVLTGTKVISAEQRDGFVALKTEGTVDTVKAVKILVAAGRLPNIDGMNLNSAGVGTDRNGVVVDKYLRTTAKNIYAAGDVVPPYQFTHVADYEAVTATRNALLPLKKAVNYADIGWCTYTSPELAGCGLTEEQAINKYGDNIHVYKFENTHLDRAITDCSTTGLAKYITDRKGKILGAHILGSRAGEVVHEVMVAKKFNIPFHKLANMVHIYPTYSYSVRQPAKYAAIDMLMNNVFVKFIRGLRK